VIVILSSSLIVSFGDGDDDDAEGRPVCGWVNFDCSLSL